MPAAMKATPNPVPAGGHLDIDMTGLDPKVKVSLTTVNDQCVEVGITSNVNRPRRSGAMYVGILAPPMKGKARVRAYQRNVVVCDALVDVI